MTKPPRAFDGLRKAARASVGRGASIIALEKRIAFDGAAVATAAKLIHHADAPDQHGPAADPIDLGREGALPRSSDLSLVRSTADRAAFGPQADARSVVFIESNVPDVATLIKDVDHSATIVMLDASQDGVDAIASFLKTHAGYKNVYIFSHGSEANLSLGTADLDASSMQGRYAADLATIRTSLGADANILVYGCDFAKNTDGNSAAALLSALTGASVAASTDPTGGSAEGGNFVLEDRIGTVDAPDILAPTIASDFDGLLSTPPKTTGAFTLTTGTTDAATSSQTVATATTSDGAIKVVVTTTPDPNNTSGSITTGTTSAANFDTTAPAGSYTANLNGAPALSETLQFPNSSNTVTISVAYYDAVTGAPVTVTDPIIAIDRLGGSGTSSSGQSVTTSSDLSILNTGATLTKLSSSSSAFVVTTTDVYETPGTPVGYPYSPDANSDPTKGTSAGSIQVNGSYQTLTFSWTKAPNSVDGLDRINLIFLTDTSVAAQGSLANRSYADGQSNVSIATAGAFHEPATTLALTYTASGLPSGLSIDPATGIISGTVDHDASKNAPTTSGSGATLQGTYDVSVTATNSGGNAATQTFQIIAANDAPVVGTTTADQSNYDGATIATLDASKAFSDPNGDPLTYSSVSLPAGLSIDPSSGLITGTVARNAQPGTYHASVTATDDKGASATERFDWTIRDVPLSPHGTLANQSYADATAGISIATAGSFTNPNNLPLTYSATGLPLGLSIDQTTGTISGQLDHDASKNAPRTTGAGATLDGTYTVTVTASDGQGGRATQTFTIDATNTAPTLVRQTPNQSGKDGQSVSVDGAKAFSDANVGDTFVYAASGLPTGLTINASTGLISGTIDKSASLSGPFTVTVAITDDKGASASETFQWAVADAPPVATPALPDTAAVDGKAVTIATAGGFTNPNNLALTYTATGLPAGLSLNASTGIISGTLDHDASVGAPGGVYAISVTANDGQGGQATNSFHLTASNQAPVVGTATANRTNTDGATISVTAGAAFSDPNGDPLTFTASNLPKGLTIDAATGVVSGTVAANAAPGAYHVTVTATDDKGLATPETFTWTITDVPPVRNGSVPNKSYADSTSGISIATASAFTSPNGLALTYAASGLPAGLTIDSGTGLVTGTLDHDASKNAPATRGSGATLDGTYTVVVTASDGQGGSATQTFTIDATNNAPVVGTPTGNQTSTQGDTTSVRASSAFSDANGGDVLTYAASNLPPGLSIDPTSGLISGTLGLTALGSYSVSITATDDKGAAATETFTWTVNLAIPIVASPIPNTTADDNSSVTIDTASHFKNGPTSYTAAGLPLGLSINSATGQITGTLDHDASKNASVTTGSGSTLDGAYSIMVTASNGSGSAQQSFTLNALNQAPVLGPSTADQASVTGQNIAAVAAGAPFTDPNGDTLTFTASGLPTGLSIDPATGTVTGTISATAPGSYAVVVTATDDKGAATNESFNWTVADQPPTAVGQVANQTYSDSASGISIATAAGFSSPNGLPLRYSASGLPAGLTIDSATGTITGQLSHDASANGQSIHGSGATLDGTYTVTVSASDGQGGLATQTFTIDATNTAPVVAAATPDQAACDGQAVSLDTAPAFSDPNTGDVLTYSAAGLPTGLTIDAATGRISGTIAVDASTRGPYAIQVTATDDKGAATTETFALAVADVAPLPSPTLPDRAAYDGKPVTYLTAGGFTNPNGLALAYSASGLPLGLSIDATTGVISGSLDHEASAAVPGGRYSVSVTVYDGQGGTATNTFILTASNQAPVVGMATASQTALDGQTVTPVDAGAAFSDPNGDTLTFSGSNLPKGLSVDPTTGRISGTVANDATPGSYYVIVTATDDKGAAMSEVFTWGINDRPPTTIGSLAGQNFADSASGVSIATAGGFTSPIGLPLSYSATGLPPGLTIDAGTGIISGDLLHDDSANAPMTTGSGATLQGIYTVHVTASDGQGGAATQTFTVTATNQAPTVVAATAGQHNADGDTVTLNVSSAFVDPNQGDVLTFSAANLPQGLMIDPTTGIISGTITSRASSASPLTVQVTATDEKQAATTETFQWIVDDLQPVATGPAIPTTTAADGASVPAIATASAFANPNGLPLTYTATGLPAGLAIDPTTGVISGTLDHDASVHAPLQSGANGLVDGTYTVVVTASDGQGGTASQSFALHATNQAPVLGTPTPDQHSADGTSVSLAISPAFADPNGDTLTYSTSGLPAGLAIDPLTGTVSGTIAATASAHGPYTVTLTATDDKGAATSETIHWIVDDVPPTATGPAIAAQTAADSASVPAVATASAFVNPNGLPLTYTASGLPAGLAIDPTTGIISGTLDHDASVHAPLQSGANGLVDGAYTVVVTASDGQGGTASQSFALHATNQAPVLGTPTPDQHSADGTSVSLAISPAFADPNGDTLTYSASGLPAGLSIDPLTGTVSGTIAATASAHGPYSVTLTATDDKGAATSETIRWIVDDVPPTATGPTIPTTTAADGATIPAVATAGAFANPNGLPLTYTATGLPPGLAIDPTTGIISGTLDHDASVHAPVQSGANGLVDGTYTVVVTASDGQGGTASQSFALHATNQAPVLGTPTPDQHNADGASVSVNISSAFADPNGDTLTYSASGLPAGLAIDPLTGIVSGTIAATASAHGPYTVTLTATDDKGAATSETIHWVVDNVPPTATGPAIPTTTAADGANVPAVATAGAFANSNGLPLTYTATGLPPGLAIDPTTGIISGTLDHDASVHAPLQSGANGLVDGTYTVVVTASDGQGGTASQSFALHATNQAPVLGTPTPDQHSADGISVSLAVSPAFADPNGDTLTYSASGLPAGLAIDPLTGTVSGTIAATASAHGPYTVTLTATDDKGAATSETIHWIVDDVPPTATGPAIAARTAADGASVPAVATASAFVNPNGLPLTYTASGLPAGLAIDPTTGVISGTLDAGASRAAPVQGIAGARLDGTYSVVVTASDGQGGSASQSFTFDAISVPPSLVRPTGPQRGLAGETVALETASAFSVPVGDQVHYTATGLPPGLAIDPATGHIGGVLASSLAESSIYSVVVTATDSYGATVSETVLWTVTSVTPSNLAAVAPNVLVPAGIDAASPWREPAFAPAAAAIEAKGAVLAAVHDISPLPELGIAVRASGIVIATVNHITPLDGLRDLSSEAVRAGALPEWDRRAEAAVLITPSPDEPLLPQEVATLGASLRDTDPLTGNDGATINVETVVRDRFLVLKVDNKTPLACVVPVARYTIMQADGRPLPGWLRSDANGVVAGKVPSDVDAIDLKVRSELASGIVSERFISVHAESGAIRSQGRETVERSGRPPGGLLDILRHAAPSTQAR